MYGNAADICMSDQVLSDVLFFTYNRPQNPHSETYSTHLGHSSETCQTRHRHRSETNLKQPCAQPSEHEEYTEKRDLSKDERQVSAKYRTRALLARIYRYVY